MKTSFVTSAILICMLLTLSSFDPAKGWRVLGNHQNKYQMGIDKGSGKDGKDAMTIKSVKKIVDNSIFGTLASSSLPTQYLGKRVRLSGLIKTKDVSDWAGFWFRVDGQKGEVLAFDNMKDGKTDRSIAGTNDWKPYDLVLDVPYHAKNLMYGALLNGEGQIWFENVTFEIVNSAIPTTGK
ncbi:MAG: hypothetical protein LWW85_05740 [Marinilabiliales bacterium]|nr:hypothetical protein [Marinilabiliales bacterium]